VNAQKALAGQRGFTLTEILIVLVIMSLMLAFAAPRFAKDLLGLSLETTAKKAAGALRYARSQALYTGRRYAAVFDGEKKRIIIAESASPAPADILRRAAAGGAAYELAGGGEPALQMPARDIKIFPLPEGISLSTIIVADTVCNEEQGDAICQMAFYPDGTAQGGEIRLVDAKERAFVLDVHFLTGVVSLEEEDEQ